MNIFQRSKLNEAHVASNRHHSVASFSNMVLTLIPAWMINYMPGKVCGEITYPFLNFNGVNVEV